MPIPLYLAMTAAEILQNPHFPEKIGWMACHFSPYGNALSNCPTNLPPGSLLILDDSTPIAHHDPVAVSQQLSAIAAAFQCDGILLDWERPGNGQAEKILKAICRDAPCPVAAPAEFAREADCAVFLSPPLHLPLAEFLAPWQGRPVWLEAAPEDACYLLTDSGCSIHPLPCPPTDFPHRDADALCRYRIIPEADSIRFCLRRDLSDLKAMMAHAGGVERIVGLYQQLHSL